MRHPAPIRRIGAGQRSEFIPPLAGLYMSIRDELIEIQKRLVKKLKTDLYQEYCLSNPEIEKYYENYKLLTGNYERIATKEELVEEILKSDICYLGDYHTFRQSQKTLIRLLSAIEPVRTQMNIGGLIPLTGSRSGTGSYPDVYRGYPLSNAVPIFRREIIVGLEMVQSSFQDILDKFLNGEIDEKDFLRDINYDKTWGFNWNNYREILNYLKEHRLKALALNSPTTFAHHPPLFRSNPSPFRHPPLRPDGYRGGVAKDSSHEKVSSLLARDSFSAKIIAQEYLRCQRHPESRTLSGREDPTQAGKNQGKSIIIVLFGDLHISENHLPHEVDRILKDRNHPLPKKLIICQNSERIYWQLAKAGDVHNVDVVKIKDNVYCVMNSTPLSVFQSCINWYNHEDELQTSQSHKNWREREETDTSFLEEVGQLVKVICEFLGLETPNLENLTVLNAHALDLLQHLSESGALSEEETRRVELDLLKTESHFIDNKHIICLTNFSLNHA
ncbi:MAG: ChaN family lipoprotein, partial [Planctomycetota bacterium]|nr:ChaN family lipoprotein [Planctomycetota bacterium]